MQKKRYKVDLVRGNFDYFSSKKGQITIFIILGILLLIALGLIIALKSELVTFKPEEIKPTEKGKVETFLTSCIEDLGNDAVNKIGLQGGYIEVPETISRDQSIHLKLAPFLVVPYWAYGNIEAIPSLELIKSRIDQYIQDNLRQCFYGDEAFQETYDIIEKSGITPDTKIVDSKVIFDVHWDLEIKDKAGEIISRVAEHSGESSVKLKRVYDTARAVVEHELATLKFEDITQDLIALESPGVPLAGMEVSCTKKKWKVNQVKATLQDLLRINIKQLKVKGTEYVEFPDEFPYYQNHYMIDLGDEFVQPEVSISFGYENNYPLIFQVTPASGNTMSSSSFGQSEWTSFLCIQSWKFTYDVVYPVFVQVQDQTTGYNFNTAFTVHIIRNVPNRDSVVTSRPSGDLQYFDDEQFCGNRRIRMTVSTNELVENQRQGVYDKEPLDGVKITYICGKIKCEMGSSEMNFAESGYQSGLGVNFPYCVGGILRGEKEGYKEVWQRVTSEPDKEVELNLVPLYKFPASKVKVIKHNLVNNELRGSSVMSKDETALIKLTNYKGNQTFHQTEQMVGEGLGEVGEEETTEDVYLELLSGADFNYVVEVSTFNGDTMTGGYKQNWTVPSTDLETANRLTFHVLSSSSSDEAEFLEWFGELEEISKLVPLPELK